MRKLLIALTLIATFALAQAQSNMMTTMDVKQPYLGVAFGSPFAFYYGLGHPVLAGDDFRIHASSNFNYIVLGADVIFDIATLDDEGRANFYAGGGPSLGVTFDKNKTAYFAVNLNAFGGLDYRLNEEFSVYAEGGFAFTVVSGFNNIGSSARLGLKYYF